MRPVSSHSGGGFQATRMAVPLTSLFVTVTPCGALLGAKTTWHIVYINLKKTKQNKKRFQVYSAALTFSFEDYFIHHPPMSWPPSPRCQPPGTHQRRGALWTRRWSLPSADRSPSRRPAGRVPPRCSTAPPAARGQQMAGKTPCNPECTGTAAPPSREINATTTSKDVCFSQYHHTPRLFLWYWTFEGNNLLKKTFTFERHRKTFFPICEFLTVNHNIVGLLIASPQHSCG